MSDADAPGAVLRELVSTAVGGDAEVSPLAVEVVERGAEPGPAAHLPALVADAASVVGVLPRVDRDLACRVLGHEDRDGDGDKDGDGFLGERDGGPTVRLVFTGDAAARFGGLGGTVIRSVLASRGVEAYRHDGDSPVGVLLAGEVALVGLFDATGLAALLWSDTPAVRRWAAETCRRYLAAADPV
jgi:hypothetical protein